MRKNDERTEAFKDRVMQQPGPRIGYHAGNDGEKNGRGKNEQSNL